jgi:hypothetical protein
MYQADRGNKTCLEQQKGTVVERSPCGRAAARSYHSEFYYRSTPSISLPHLKHFFSWIWYLRI